jgi:hypothetical protein
MKDPAFLFYPADFLVGCADLTMQERGQYITLLCLEHQKGRLSEKTCRLNLGLLSVSEIPDVMAKFKIDAEGLYYNERLELEINKRHETSEYYSNKGKKGGAPKGNQNAKKTSQKQPKNNPKTNIYENENENRNENIIEFENEIRNNNNNGEFSFLKIWEIYEKKGNKKTSERKWQSLPDKTKQLIFEHVPKYVNATPDLKYRKNFETYLNQEAWNDEIITLKSKNNKNEINYRISVPNTGYGKSTL